MSDRPHVTIIGSGCAGLSLARILAGQDLADISLKTDISYRDRHPHIWGFWGMDWLDDAMAQAHHSWTKWQIITADQTITHHSTAHPYHMLHSDSWLSFCHAQSGSDEVIAPVTTTPDAPYFDSRPLPAPKGALYQHFLGQRITADHDVFDETTAILMDFRCDQSQGLHFIYLLPDSPRTALVESTLFTATPLDKSYYIKAIKDYMARHYAKAAYQITDTEAGIIPLADCRDRKAPHHAIGARGGALRPSSGYGFSFIQRQAAMIAADYKKTGIWQSRSPLSGRDLWMDSVFLSVLAQHPQRSIALFSRLASALSGSEFACFMSGRASLGTLIKVVLAMPKLPFITAALRVTIARVKS